MKCIVYISKVAERQNGALIPTGFSEIFRLARKRNSLHSITGVLSYRSGYYFQVFEGVEEAVTQLYSNIRDDPRHSRVTKLLEFSIQERSFPGWDMKLLNSVDKNTEFLNFLNKYSDEISTLDQDQRRLFKIFSDVKASPPGGVESYQGKDLTLSAWPDLTLITPSPIVIELCARLTRTKYSYQRLVDAKEFGTQQELDIILNKFEMLGILKTSDSVDAVSGSQPSVSSTGFYSKMKDFLGLG